MNAWISLILDVVLIGLVSAGLVQAMRLIRHLAGLRQGRADMERFVREFNTTVVRAEAGITGLKHAARESGDDLEKLVEKAFLIRDELRFLVDSADQIANRLSENAASAVRPPERTNATADTRTDTKTPAPRTAKPSLVSSSQASRAERELMQALEKLG